jgi:hypothetical protein
VDQVAKAADPSQGARQMTVEEFRQSIAGDPPPGLSHALLALWQDARGDWAAAHEAAQGDASAECAWVHAYLHRKEGDQGNASYWYRRAAQPFPKLGLEAEWAHIAGQLLEPQES